jgi:hypothetical protein
MATTTTAAASPAKRRVLAALDANAPSPNSRKLGLLSPPPGSKLAASAASEKLRAVVMEQSPLKRACPASLGLEQEADEDMLPPLKKPRSEPASAAEAVDRTTREVHLNTITP